MDAEKIRELSIFILELGIKISALLSVKIILLLKLFAKFLKIATFLAVILIFRF